MSVGQPCDEDGYDLPSGMPPLPFPQRRSDDYEPYASQANFELADFLYRKEQMSANKIDQLMEILAKHQSPEYDQDHDGNNPMQLSLETSPGRLLLLHMMAKYLKNLRVGCPNSLRCGFVTRSW